MAPGALGQRAMRKPAPWLLRGWRRSAWICTEFRAQDASGPAMRVGLRGGRRLRERVSSLPGGLRAGLCVSRVRWERVGVRAEALAPGASRGPSSTKGDSEVTALLGELFYRDSS